jgi:acyl-CoA dehydrogenase
VTLPALLAADQNVVISQVSTTVAPVPKVNYTLPSTLFSLPPELVELKNLVREIVNNECIPLEAKFLANNPAWPRGGGKGGISVETLIDGTLEQSDWDRLAMVTESSGLTTALLPEEYGGLGMGVLGAFVVAEELNRTLVPLPIVSVVNALYHCNDEQKEKYLCPQMRGEKSACYAQTEPGAGSDPGNMATRAVRDGDEWVINGSKTFISGAASADFHLLLAVTDPAKRQRGGITMFIVDSDVPGITVSPLHTWQSQRAHQFAVSYDDVRVPDGAVLGSVGGGFALGQQFLAIQDRLTRGSMATGFLTRGLEMAASYAQERVTFGQPLSERQAIQWMLVDVLIDIKAIRAISYECAARADQGEDVRAHAAMAKLVGANWGHRSMDKLMQVFGGIGEAMDFPIPHWYHQIRHGRIGGGTDEIQRILIQRAIFKQGSSLWLA